MRRINRFLVPAIVCMLAGPVSAAGLKTWDKIINGPGRFKVLKKFSDEAVLDKETGLVWERDPDTAVTSWLSGADQCYGKNIGGRRGWRIPTAEEAMSLSDPDEANPALPPGHPFTGLVNQNVWTSTTVPGNTAAAHRFQVGNGLMGYAAKSIAGGIIWCVRGYSGHNTGG